jgi:hypothetical protein
MECVLVIPFIYSAPRFAIVVVLFLLVGVNSAVCESSCVLDDNNTSSVPLEDAEIRGVFRDLDLPHDNFL